MSAWEYVMYILLTGFFLLALGLCSIARGNDSPKNNLPLGLQSRLAYGFEQRKSGRDDLPNKFYLGLELYREFNLTNIRITPKFHILTESLESTDQSKSYLTNRFEMAVEF